MSYVTSISIDSSLLRLIRETDPTFNLSAMVNDMLKQYIEKSKNLGETMLKCEECEAKASLKAWVKWHYICSACGRTNDFRHL